MAFPIARSDPSQEWDETFLSARVSLPSAGGSGQATIRISVGWPVTPARITPAATADAMKPPDTRDRRRTRRIR